MGKDLVTIDYKEYWSGFNTLRGDRSATTESCDATKCSHTSALLVVALIISVNKRNKAGFKTHGPTIF